MFRQSCRVVLAVAALGCFAATAAAQVSTSRATKTFEVIAVDGNHLVVRLPEGTRELTVPADFRFNVDGRDMSVADLKPGMKGTATITTTTTVTPVTVTEIKNGTVMQASGSSITVRTDNGIKMFTENDVAKRGVKIMRDGQPAALSDFHSGDKLTATIVTTHPPKVVTEQQVQASLAREAAPPAGAGAPPAAAAAHPGGAPPSGAGAPAATTGAPAPARRLPKTASSLPLVGLTGFLLLGAAAALNLRRRRLSR